MTIQELFEILESEIQNGNGDKKVKISSDYGDICHTAQSLDINDVTFGSECESGYSHSGYQAVCGTRDDDILFIVAQDEAEIREVDDGDDEGGDEE